MNFKEYLPSEKYEKLTWLFCCLFLIVLTISSLFHEMGGYGVETDFYGAFAPGARALMEGRVDLDPGYGPGYEFALILFYPLFQDLFAAGKLISILSGFFLCIITFKLISRLFHPMLGFFTIVPLALVILPWAVISSTDIFFAFIVAGCLYVLLKDKQITTKHLLWSGLLAGFVYITRHNGIAVFATVGFILLIINPDEKSWVERGKDLVIFFGASLMITVPWSITNYLVNDNPFHSDSYLIIASHFYGRPGIVVAEDMHISAEKFQSLTDVVFYDFKHFVLHYIGNLYRHFRDILLNSIKLPLGLFVLPGLMLIFKKVDRWQLSFISVPIFSFFLLCLVHYEPRYYLYIISFFVFYAAYFFFGNWQSEVKPFFFKIINWVVYSLAILLLLGYSSRDLKNNLSSEPLELVKVSNNLKDEVKENEIIIARKPHLGFLSNLKTVYFPSVNSVDDLLVFARDVNARYILFGEYEIKLRPELRELLNIEMLPPTLETIYSSHDPQMVVLRILN